MTIDGTVIAPISGPCGGLYYSCKIGTWLAGSHTYKITATDSKGLSATFGGTFLVVAASNSNSGASSLAMPTSIAASQRADLLAAVMREMATYSLTQDDESGGMP